MYPTHRPVIAAALLAALLSSATAIGASSPAFAAVQPDTRASSGAATPPAELARVLAELTKLGRAADAAGTASRKAASRATRAARAAKVAAAARDDAEARAREAALAAAVSRARASSAAAQLARSGSTGQDTTGLILQGLGAKDTLWGLSRMSELSISSTTLFSEATAAKAAADEAATVAARTATQAADRAKEARTAAIAAKKRYSAVTDLIARQRARIQELSTQAEDLTDEAALTTAPVGATSAGWIVPATGTLRDGFGPRPNMPVAGVSPFHRGQDIAAPCGTPIHAAASGTVVQAGYLGSYGNWALLDNGNGIQSGYAHSTKLLVRPGQKVTAGQTIATVGSTGASSGCHLHFEVHVRGVAIDPVPFMAGRDAPLTQS
jgi:murein DD-endopeptidase MepM/ murein hydrolase activator NlpD